MIKNFTLGNATYSLLDDGIANILGLESLRHGTNPTNNIRIRIFGGSPAHGGKSTGSTKGWCVDNTQNYFYVFKDSEFGLIGHTPNLFDKIFLLIPRARLHPYLHSFLSGYNLIGRVTPNIPVIGSIIKIAGGILSLALSPTLRFRFSTIDRIRFEEDYQYSGLAYKTPQKIEAWRLGILGSLITGVNPGWFSRVREKPLKVLTGVAQLSCLAILATRFTSPSQRKELITSTPFLLGALLA